MGFLYVVLAVIFLVLVVQGVAGRRGGSRTPSIDRYHQAMTRLGEMSEHVKLLDERDTPEHQASRTVRDVRPASGASSTLPPPVPPWANGVRLEPVTATPLSQEPLVEGTPAVEEDELPPLELLNADEPVPDAGEARPLAAADEGAAGVRGTAGRALARLRTIPTWAGIVAAVVVLGGPVAGVLLTSSSPPARRPASGARTGLQRPAVVVRALPDLIGLSAAQAEAHASAAGFRWQLFRVPSPDAAAAGQVLAQAPAFPGTLAVGGIVILRVGEPVAQVAVPDVENQSVAAAEAALRKAGFVTRTTPVKAVSMSQLALQGEVLREAPTAGRAEAKHSIVTLDIVSGAASVSVPSAVIGEPLAQAGATLAGTQLRVGTTSSAFSTTVPSGEVSAALPRPGQPVAIGTTVNLVVSAGPPAVVPKLRGDTLAEARHALRAAALALGKVNYAPGPNGIVLAQAARAGKTLPPGTPITLVVGQTGGGGSGTRVTTASPAGNSGT